MKKSVKFNVKGGITINIATVDVIVKMDNHHLTKRELKIMEVLFLNLAAQVNAQVIKNGMALNPLERKENEDIFHYRLAWQQSISLDQYEEMKAGISNRYTIAIKMCELPEATILFKENAYSTNS